MQILHASACIYVRGVHGLRDGNDAIKKTAYVRQPGCSPARTMRMPRPPPPIAAFKMMGYPLSLANACAASAVVRASFVPGTTGTPHASAAFLACHDPQPTEAVSFCPFTSTIAHETGRNTVTVVIAPTGDVQRHQVPCHSSRCGT